MAERISRAKEQLSARLPADVVETLDRFQPQINRTETLERDLSRHYSLLATAKQELRERFSDEELNLVMEACNGWMVQSHIHYLWAEVANAIRLKKLDEVWGVRSPDELVGRLRELHLYELIAMEDAILTFWHDANSTLDVAFGMDAP